jgi:transcriptional regulator with XRE-family HTH domain
MNAKDEQKKAAIASRLALARKQAGLTQGQVAAMLKLHRPSISEAEAGRRNVTASEIARLAEIYGVNVAWLSCANSDEAEPARDRVQLAARELAKLKDEDLGKVLDLLQALRESGGET